RTTVPAQRQLSGLVWNGAGTSRRTTTVTLAGAREPRSTGPPGRGAGPRPQPCAGRALLHDDAGRCRGGRGEGGAAGGRRQPWLAAHGAPGRCRGVRLLPVGQPGQALRPARPEDRDGPETTPAP